MEITKNESLTTGRIDYKFSIDRYALVAQHGDRIFETVLQRAVKDLAAAVVKECLPEVMARLDPQAIANMTLAQAATEIKRTLDEHVKQQRQQYYQWNSVFER